MGVRQTNQKKYLSHSIDLFQGGMDSDASPYMLAPGMASVGENIEFYRDNTLRSRRGWSRTALASKQGMFLTHRVDGQVRQIYRNGAALYALTNGVVTNLGAVANNDHTLLRTLNGVLVVQPEKIRLYDSDGLNSAALATPGAMTAVVAVGGNLTEGKYHYFYHYLLDGGEQSETSPELVVEVPGKDYKITLTFPNDQSHPKQYKKRVYRQDPGGGVPLFISELEPSATTLVDTGLSQSALTFQQGLRAMPGGNLALMHNRRLFTVDRDTLNYSYTGSYAYGNVFWTEKINLPTGEPIRAMCPLGQGIIFFGLETATFMNGAPAEGGSFAPIPVPDGCVGKNAWTQAEDGTLFYVGKSGVYAMQGMSTQRISDPMNAIFKGLSVAELAGTTLVYDQQERRLLVSLPNQILAFYFQTRAWTVWTLPDTELDWFEGQIHAYIANGFALLGEAPTDNGSPIVGKFVSGLTGLDDPVMHKLFRRIGVQVSASATDTVDLYVRSVNHEADYSGLPARELSGAIWGDAVWGVSTWGGNTDTVQTVSLPDRIQGRYIQYAVTFSTTDAGRFILTGPVVIEYRPQYRYGRD